MLSQYLELKKQQPDAILFYRMGDFYEMFFEDALTAAPVLEVQLTSRDRNAVNPVPMCGIPHHALTPYLQKLLAKGFKVAICEQMEDPVTAKGIVRREVIRVVTPALIGDPDLVPDETRNILLCLWQSSGPIEACTLDLLSGEIHLGQIEGPEKIADLFYEFLPKELLIPHCLADKKWLLDALKLFPRTVVTNRGPYFETTEGDMPRAQSALVKYLRETQKLDSTLR